MDCGLFVEAGCELPWELELACSSLNSAFAFYCIALGSAQVAYSYSYRLGKCHSAIRRDGQTRTGGPKRHLHLKSGIGHPSSPSGGTNLVCNQWNNNNGSSSHTVFAVCGLALIQTSHHNRPEPYQALPQTHRVVIAQLQCETWVLVGQLGW